MLKAAQSAADDRTREEFFVGEWLIQPRLGAVSKNGNSSHLEHKPMRVLVCLAEHAGGVVSKDELMRNVWPDTFVTEHVLTRAIRHLRQAFGSDDYIQTYRGSGYRLTAKVRPVATPIRSIAVMPLVNLSGDPQQEYFADGMTEALISAVAQIGALRVISRTSAMQYKATSKPVAQIGAELAVQVLVEGSVVRNGNHVRISAQLIDAARDQHLWARNYDSDLRDILEMQDEMARTIADEIEVTLTPEEHRRLSRRRPVNPVAHELYLKGRHCFFRLSEDGLRTSLAYMQQALAVDPEYALAYAGLGDAVAIMATVSGMTPEVIQTARWAVQRELELDPALPQGHHQLGWIRMHYDWDWTGAEESMKHAVALDPSHAIGHGVLGELYGALNRHDEAIAAARHACKLDPLSLYLQSALALALILAGRPAEAVDQLQAAIRLEPNYYRPYIFLVVALAELGRFNEAITAAEKAVRLSDDPLPKAFLGYAYSCAGRTADAEKIFLELQELGKTRVISPMISAGAHVRLGDLDRALDYLEQACEMRESEIIYLRSFPIWRPLYDHPRFQEIVRRMKFPE